VFKRAHDDRRVNVCEIERHGVNEYVGDEIRCGEITTRLKRSMALREIFWATVCTSSSAAAERPREPLSQLKSCQLLHNCAKNHI